ncbi:MAG: TRAP transporter small permease subunit [Hyphomicrobiales bacterium]|nr:TRAP transporter small permease subunit [Hyphomicrobiales bacterium]
MLTYITFANKLSAWVGKAFAWSILIMTLGVTYEVIARKFFRAPTPWAYDVSYIMYGALFMMAGAYTLSRDAHVRADMFYRAWPPRRQASVEILLYLIFFLPGMLALLITGWSFAMQSYGFNEVSINSGVTPIFQLKMIIPAAAFFLLIQGVAQVCRAIICLRTGEWPPLLHDVEETESVLLHAKQDHEQTKQEFGLDK